MSKPTPRFTVITLGVSDIRASIAFYEALGFARKMQATGEAVAFFDTGGTMLALSRGSNSPPMSRCLISRGQRPFADRRWPGIAVPPKKSMRCWISQSPAAPRC